MGKVLRFLMHRTAETLIVIFLIVVMPSVPPNAKFNKSFKVKTPMPLEGKLALNNNLNNVEKWHEDELHGPEAFADYNGELYTTLYGGDIVKLTGNKHITPVVKFGKPCKGIYEEKICGRPLGLTFDQNGWLYAADAYYGIFKVNVKTGDKIKLVAFNEEIEGKKVQLPNNLAVAKNGDIFWSDSSTEFTLQDGVFDLLADGSGRLIHYDAKTKKNKVLIDNIHFANGVILADDESFVLVAETARSRIHRYYLQGPKKGTHDIFIDGLPGLPDNLSSDRKNGFLVPLIIPVDKHHPYFFQILEPFPLIRKFFARVLGLIQLSFKVVEELYPNEYSERAIHFVGHFQMRSVLPTSSGRTTILRLSKNGEILESLHNTNNKISSISEAYIFKDTLYLGSPFNDYIGRIALSKIGWENLASHAKPSATTTTTQTPKPATTTTTPKSTTTTPRPTTTTPKPTTTTPKPTTTSKPTTTTPKPTITTSKPPTTTSKPPTTTSKPPTTTSKPPTTTFKPPTTTSKPPTTTSKPTTTTPKPVTTTSKPSTKTTPKPSTTTSKPATTTTKPPEKTPTTTAKPVNEQSKTVPGGKESQNNNKK